MTAETLRFQCVPNSRCHPQTADISLDRNARVAAKTQRGIIPCQWQTLIDSRFYKNTQSPLALNDHSVFDPSI